MIMLVSHTIFMYLSTYSLSINLFCTILFLNLRSKNDPSCTLYVSANFKCHLSLSYWGIHALISCRVVLYLDEGIPSMLSFAINKACRTLGGE